MADLNTTNIFVDGEVVDATRFNTNYSDIVTYINERNAGTTTWDMVSSASASNVPLIANNSTGTQNIFQAKDNGITVFQILDGGIVSAPSQDYFIATKSAPQTFSANDTKVTFDTVSQSASSFSTSTSRFTCATVGKYSIKVRVSVNANGAIGPVALAGMYISKNGTSFYSQISTFASVGGTDNGRGFTYSDILNLSANDYLEVYVNAIYPTATVISVGATSVKTVFSGFKLS